MENATGIVSSIPILGWIVIFLSVCVLAAVIIIVFRNKNIKTPFFTANEKLQIQAEGRELSDNQMRSGKALIGSLKSVLRDKAYESFPYLKPFEIAYLNLLFEHIIQYLIEQYRIDLVRNHIVKKTESELYEYTQAKSEMYYLKVRSFLDEYNIDLPEYDFMKIMEKIPQTYFYETYAKVYRSAKQLSLGY